MEPEIYYTICIMNRDKKKGFTLIELLVVVAIIGILSTIVLAALGSARSKSKDAKIKLMMKQMQTQATVFLLEHDSYHGTLLAGARDDDILNCTGLGINFNGTMFDSATLLNVTELSTSIAEQSIGALPRVYCAVGPSTVTDSWAFAAPLHNPASGNTGFCVDSSGNAKDVNLTFNTSYVPLGGGANGLAICP